MPVPTLAKHVAVQGAIEQGHYRYEPRAGHHYDSYLCQLQGPEGKTFRIITEEQLGRLAPDLLALMYAPGRPHYPYISDSIRLNHYVAPEASRSDGKAFPKVGRLAMLAAVDVGKA